MKALRGWEKPRKNLFLLDLDLDLDLLDLGLLGLSVLLDCLLRFLLDLFHLLDSFLLILFVGNFLHSLLGIVEFVLDAVEVLFLFLNHYSFLDQLLFGLYVLESVLFVVGFLLIELFGFGIDCLLFLGD